MISIAAIIISDVFHVYQSEFNPKETKLELLHRFWLTF